MRNKTEMFGELEVLAQRITRGFWEQEGLNMLYSRYYQLWAEIIGNSLELQNNKEDGK